MSRPSENTIIQVDRVELYIHRHIRYSAG